jgi:hypothetical protein
MEKPGVVLRIAYEVSAIVIVFSATFAGFAWALHRYVNLSWGQTVGFMLPAVLLLTACAAYGYWLGLKARRTGELAPVLDGSVYRGVAKVLLWEALVLVPAFIALYFFFTGRAGLGVACSLIAGAAALWGTGRIKVWLRDSTSRP